MKPEFRKKAKSSNHWLDGGHFAIGLMAGLVIALFFWLGNDLLSSGIVASDAKELVPSIATAIVALVSVVLAGIALREQRIMRQAGTDPVLVAHVGQRDDEPIMINLNISNVGAGAAMNVFANVVVADSPQLQKMLGNPLATEVMTGKMPIKVILQNDKVTYELGMGHELIGSDPLAPFKIELKYQDIEGNEYNSSHEINVAELTGRPAVSPATTKIWREIEKIGKKIK